MATAPVITYRASASPYSVLSSLLFAKSSLGTDFMPLPGTEYSNVIAFRVYNNYAKANSIATANNFSITLFDGAHANSHTAAKSLVSQSWIRIYESGFGESTVAPGAYTQYIGDDEAIGRSGADAYIPGVGSDGNSVSRIRAGVNQNGIGFIEFNTYAEIPDQVGFASYDFALSVLYEWTS